MQLQRGEAEQSEKWFIERSLAKMRSLNEYEADQ
jgi:hypothetical protein